MEFGGRPRSLKGFTALSPPSQHLNARYAAPSQRNFKKKYTAQVYKTRGTRWARRAHAIERVLPSSLKTPGLFDDLKLKRSCPVDSDAFPSSAKLVGRLNPVSTNLKLDFSNVRANLAQGTNNKYVENWLYPLVSWRVLSLISTFPALGYHLG